MTVGEYGRYIVEGRVVDPRAPECGHCIVAVAQEEIDLHGILRELEGRRVRVVVLPLEAKP
mgnify:CR=1 FL=1